jgi:hypothetical protein
MQTATKSISLKDWEYYLAIFLAILGTVAVLAMALRVFGVI